MSSFRARPGGQRGSHYLQALSAFLDAYYCIVPFEDIFKMVRNIMIRDQVRRCVGGDWGHFSCLNVSKYWCSCCQF